MKLEAQAVEGLEDIEVPEEFEQPAAFEGLEGPEAVEGLEGHEAVEVLEGPEAIDGLEHLETTSQGAPTLTSGNCAIPRLLSFEFVHD